MKRPWMPCEEEKEEEEKVNEFRKNEFVAFFPYLYVQ